MVLELFLVSFLFYIIGRRHKFNLTPKQCLFLETYVIYTEFNLSKNRVSKYKNTKKGIYFFRASGVTCSEYWPQRPEVVCRDKSELIFDFGTTSANYVKSVWLHLVNFEILFGPNGFPKLAQNNNMNINCISAAKRIPFGLVEKGMFHFVLWQNFHSTVVNIFSEINLTIIYQFNTDNHRFMDNIGLLIVICSKINKWIFGTNKHGRFPKRLQHISTTKDVWQIATDRFRRIPRPTHYQGIWTTIFVYYNNILVITLGYEKVIGFY